MVKDKSEICGNCKHSMKGNLHGPDQNDMFMAGDELMFTGRCTYCYVCNPKLRELLKKKKK